MSLFAGKITSDAMLGAVGCSMAAAAATFGIYMTIHGPAESLGTSKDFTVFAQLAPHRMDRARRAAPPRDDLDMTATATVGPRPPVRTAPADDGIVPGIILRAADDDHAEILLDGETRSVRVGDTIPGAGEVLAIRAGREPSVRTTAGVILAAR